jgi:hypothetical protein
MTMITWVAVLALMTIGCCYGLVPDHDDQDHDHHGHDHDHDGHDHKRCITANPPNEDAANFNAAILRYKLERSNGLHKLGRSLGLGTLRTIIVPVHFVM